MPNGQIISGNIENPNQAQGVANRQFLLLDAAQGAAGDPGIWVPFTPFRNATLQVSTALDANAVSTMVATVTMVGSNNAVQPANAFQITLAGSLTTGDVLNVTINGVPGPAIVVAYTVKVTDTTLAILTASLAAAITTAITGAEAQVSPATLNTNLSAANLYVTKDTAAHTININWTYPMPPLQVVVSKSGGASETIAVAAFDYGDGFTIGSATATGIAQFNFPLTWIKAKLSGWTSGAITAIVQACLP